MSGPGDLKPSSTKTHPTAMRPLTSVILLNHSSLAECHLPRAAPLTGRSKLRLPAGLLAQPDSPPGQFPLLACTSKRDRPVTIPGASPCPHGSVPASNIIKGSKQQTQTQCLSGSFQWISGLGWRRLTPYPGSRPGPSIWRLHGLEA